jgi:hypothetical protein
MRDLHNLACRDGWASKSGGDKRSHFDTHAWWERYRAAQYSRNAAGGPAREAQGSESSGAHSVNSQEVSGHLVSLGLPPDSRLSHQSLKIAFRMAALRWHPGAWTSTVAAVPGTAHDRSALHDGRGPGLLVLQLTVLLFHSCSLQTAGLHSWGKSVRRQSSNLRSARVHIRPCNNTWEQHLEPLICNISLCPWFSLSSLYLLQWIIICCMWWS